MSSNCRFRSRAETGSPSPAVHPVRIRLRCPPAPPVRELTPEEKARIAAYRQELEALSAPTATGGGFNGVGRTSSSSLPTREGDIEQMTALFQAMQGPAGQRGAVDLRGAAAAAKAAISTDGPSSEDYVGQNMQDRKSAFLSNARGESREKYIKSSRVRPLSKYEIKAGWDIPAVLEQSLNSDLPGEIRALVRENVYDTAFGQLSADSAGLPIAGCATIRGSRTLRMA